MTFEPITFIKFVLPYAISVVTAAGAAILYSYQIMNTEIQIINTEMAVLKSEFEHLQTNNAPHDNKINTLSVNQNIILTKLANHDQRFNQLDKKIDMLAERMDQQTEMIINIIKDSR